MQGLKYDMAAYASWSVRCKDRSSQLYFQKLEHQQTRHGKAQAVAMELTKPSTKQRFRIVALDGSRGRDPSAEDFKNCMSEFEEFQKLIIQSQMLSSVDDLAPLALHRLVGGGNGCAGQSANACVQGSLPMCIPGYFQNARACGFGGLFTGVVA
eukprot:9856436-Alexandrium_andersonii.AAC.1